MSEESSNVADLGAAGDPTGLEQPSSKNLGAVVKTPMPTLRVEELRDEDGHSSSGPYGSEEEGVSGSDAEAAGVAAKELPEFVPPDAELVDKILKQVEFYFSDANILKDAFLLKHVRRNRQGYVSLKLITSFKKVKSLTKDFRAVAYSLRQSDKLEVNEEGTKLRRREPLPEYDETTPSRTIVAVNLPTENPTIESVAELFSPCGDIALIRILRPGKPVPQDVKKHAGKHPELGTTVCAVVEFESHDSAVKACQTLTNTDDWRKGLRVVLLAAKSDKKDKKQKGAGRGAADAAGTSGHKGEDEGGKDEEGKKRKKNGRKKNSRVGEVQRSGSPYHSSGSDMDGADTAQSATNTPQVSPQGKGEPAATLALGEERPRANSLGPYTETGGRPQSQEGGGKGRRKSDHMQRSSLSPTPGAGGDRLSPRSTPGNSPRASPRGSPASRRKHVGRSPLAQDLSPSPHRSAETSPSNSPWVQRRLKAAQEQSPLAGNSPGASPLMPRRTGLHSDCITREPKGPDGTRGFYDGKGRGKPISPLAAPSPGTVGALSE